MTLNLDIVSQLMDKIVFKINTLNNKEHIVGLMTDINVQTMGHQTAGI